MWAGIERGAGDLAGHCLLEEGVASLSGSWGLSRTADLQLYSRWGWMEDREV